MKQRITILGIDPGLTTTGYNITIYDTITKKAQVQHRGMITAIALTKKNKKDNKECKEFGNIIPLMIYEQEIATLIKTFHPDFIACEDAFYNPRTPNAFLSLKLCITSIKRALYLIAKKPLYLISPRAAKLAVWGRGDANKLAVQESIQHLPNLILKNTKQNPLSKMTEHEADSIAITYAFITNFLQDIIMQEGMIINEMEKM